MIWVPVVAMMLGQASGDVAALRERALRETQALEYVRELSDGVGPRLAGSPGDKRAVAWAVAKMKQLGFQNVRAEPVKVPHWERISESAEIVSPVRQRLLVTALGNSPSSPAKGTEGDVLMVPSLEALAAVSPAQVKGRIVFFNKKMVRDPSGRGYAEAVDVRGKGMRAAAELGAIAVVVRSIGTSSARFPHTGNLRKEEEKGKKTIPAAALAIPDAELLERLLARGPVRLNLKLQTRSFPDADSANVVGELPGAGALADGIIVIGAHLDSWDLGTGAVDDGAGVGAVLEAARLLSTEKTASARTVRVVLFANEENGGKGGDAYSLAHAAELDRHHAALVSDSGAGRARGLAYQAGKESEPQLQSILGSLAPLKVEGALTYRHMSHPDIDDLMKAGVPIVVVSQDASRYFDLHHSADDTFDKIDPEEYRQFVAAVTTVVQQLRTMEKPLARIPEDERKDE